MDEILRRLDELSDALFLSELPENINTDIETLLEVLRKLLQSRDIVISVDEIESKIQKLLFYMDTRQRVLENCLSK